MTRHATLVALLLAGLLPLAARAEDEPAPPPGSVAAARRPLPAIESDAFRFVVLSDTHASIAHPENRAAFERIVKEAAALQPDLAVFTGDNVDGHVADAEALERNWEVFDEIASRLPCPYRLVVGNNDVQDPTTADLWLRRYGALSYAFRLGNARFVCLDSEPVRSPGRIDDAGLRLLREPPREGEHLFVFVHRPLWRTPPPASNWTTDVQPLLAAHPSTHVFAGHWHHYERGNARDGVRHTVACPAGGQIGSLEAAGEFHAFLLVTVKGEDVTVQVVRDGKVLPEDVVTEDGCARLKRLEESVQAEEVSLTGAASLEVQRGIRLENVLEKPLELTLAVSCPEGCSWRVQGEPETVIVAPGASHASSWRLRLDGDALPLPRIHATGRSEGAVVLDHEMPWPARFERRLEVVRAETAPTLDGVLDESAWSTAVPAARFVTLRGDAYAERATTMRALWTPEHLYVALECAEPDMDQLATKGTERDWGMLTDDAVLLFLSLERDGPCTCLGSTAAGVPMEFRIAGGPPDFAWNGPWEVATARGARAWTLELAIPWSTLAFEPAGGATFALGVYRHAVPGGPELSGWTPPRGGRLANPEAFGEAVLR